MDQTYFPTVRIADYRKFKEQIEDFDELLKSAARLFHEHNVPLDKVDLVTETVRQHIHAEYNGYGDAFDKPNRR